MSILSLQRRLHERGRIRIGQKVPTSGGRERPEKLDRFRFTSSDRAALDQAAVLWGGTVVAWQAPAGQQWELVSESTDIPVVVPPADFGFSQFMEAWSGGGCQRRCDSDTEMISGQPCICAAQDEVICKPTSRLSVMLPDLAGMGLWRLETHGWNAAAELAGTMDLIQRALGSGRILPARLRLQQRSTIITPPGKSPQTVRFAVPVLDLDVRLDELTAAPTANQSIGATAAAALPSGEPRFTPVPVGELPEAPSSSIADQVASVGDPPARPARSNAQQPIPSTGLAPRTAAQAQVAGESAPPADAAARSSLPSPVMPDGDPQDWTPAMIARINKIADPKMRKAAMTGFKVAFGDPPHVGPDQVQDAVATIHQFEPQPDPPDGGGSPAAAPEVDDEDPGAPFFPEDDPAETKSETPAEQHARLQRGLMAQAAKAFPKETGMLPKAARDRQTVRRHVVAWVALGRHVSTNDMTTDEILKATAALKDAEQGVYRVTEADGQWTVTRSDGLVLDVPAEILTTATQAAAA